MTCDDKSRDDSLATGVVYPLAYAKQKETEGKKKRVFLGDDLWVECQGGDDTCGSEDGERVPPMFYLKPGERVTHVCIFLPNAQDERDRYLARSVRQHDP